MILMLMVKVQNANYCCGTFGGCLNFVGNFDLSIITDSFAHSSPRSDVVFQSIDKLLGGWHGIYIRDQGVFTNQNLCCGNTRVNDRSVREDGVCSYSFISMMLKTGNLDLKCFCMGI